MTFGGYCFWCYTDRVHWSLIMNIEMIQPRHPTKGVESFGFHCVAGQRRGTLRVQFKNAHEELTALGDYLEIPNTLWQSLRVSHNPMSFIAQQVKPHFEWRVCAEPEPLREPPDETLPDLIVIPADTPNTIEAIDNVIDSQRINRGLFA